MKTSRALKASRSLREGFAKASRRLQPYPRRLREGFAKAPRAPPFGNDSSDNDKPPEGEKAIGSRRVLSYKSNKDGNITKTKARLVAKGFMQREGVNYLQTSVPTPAGASVKTMLVVTNEMVFKTYHLDVKQEFTKAKLDCKIVMKLPGGCGELSGKYVDLEKALHGLK